MRIKKILPIVALISFLYPFGFISAYAEEIVEDSDAFKTKDEILYCINGSYPGIYPRSELTWNLSEVSQVRLYRGWNKKLNKPESLLFVSNDSSGVHTVFPGCPHSVQEDRKTEEYYLEVRYLFKPVYYLKLEVTAVYIENPN